MRKPPESTAPESMYVMPSAETWIHYAREVILYLEEKGVEHDLDNQYAKTSPSIEFTISEVSAKFFTEVVDPWFRDYVKRMDLLYSFTFLHPEPEPVIIPIWNLRIEIRTNPHWEGREW